MHHRGHSQSATHIGEHRGQLIVLLQHLQQLLGLDAVLTRHQHQPLGQIVLSDLDLQLVGDGIHQQLGLDRLLRVAAVVGVEFFAAAALLGELLGELLLVVVHTVDGVVQGVVDLGLHHLLRQRHVDLFEQLLDGLVPDLLSLLHPLDLGDLLAQVLAQLVDGVELAGQLGEIVVEFGQLARLDRLDGDGHLGLLAGMAAGHQCGGEDPALALLETDDRLVQTVDELARTDLVGQPLGVGLGDVLAVDGGRQVDRDEVAGLGGALDAGQGAEALLQRFQLGVDVVVVDLDGVDGQGQRGEVRQVDLGADVDLGGEHQLLVVLELGDLDLRLPQGLQRLGGDGLAVAAGQRVVDDLLEHRPAPDTGFQQLAGGLAGPEAGQPDLLGELLEGLVDLRLELSEGHLHVDANPGRAQLLDGALHVRTPLLMFVIVRSRG